jgi:hypothetical protein
LRVSARQLQKKFKHAADFGVTGPYTAESAEAFEAALHSHVAGASVHQSGTYRGTAVTFHVDSSSGVVVIESSSGEFVSGWRLPAAKVQLLLSTKKLGGG